MNYRTKLLSIFFFLFLAFQAQAKTIKEQAIFKNLNRDKSIQSYFELEKDFLGEFCPPKVEEEFQKKYKDFSGSGFYLPKLADNSLYKEAIITNLPLINKKISWLQNEINSLKRSENFKSELENLEKLRLKFEELIILKSDFYKNTKESKQLKITSKYKFIEFREEFNSYLRSISFLRYMDFPVNYFDLRKVYDSLLVDDLKHQEKETWYLKRKIYEDGAQDSDHSRSDFYLRSVISMTVIKMEEKSDLLPSDLYYDLDYLFRAIHNLLQRGLDKQRERLKEWLSRTIEAQKYYENLLRLSAEESSNFSLLSQSSEARAELKKFVYSRQAGAYEFWSKQSDLMQALYSLETILQNEVGGLDGDLALDRQDVIQVVINRLLIPSYLELSEKDDIFHFLNPQLKKAYSKYPWLNVLFKQGEFSFTYFFLSASAKVFCPAQNPASKKLRAENLSLIIDKLQSPDWSFAATRYFSRASMTARIDMSSLWPKHSALLERVGPLLEASHSAYSELSTRAWEVIYDFKNLEKKVFWVIRLEQKHYVYDPKEQQIYFYRDPHLFRYFQSRYL